MQPSVIAFASDSTEESDTVACVTEKCRTVKHGPIANTPLDVDHLVFGSPAQICIQSHMDDVVQLPKPSEVQYTFLTAFEISCDSLQFCLWGRRRSCCISHDFARTEKQCQNVVLSCTDRFQHLIGTLDVPAGPTCRVICSS